jgi:hypothetical protein
MCDPLLIDEGEKRIPDEWRARYLSQAVRPKDMSVAFDRIHTLQRDKDSLLNDLLQTREQLNKAKTKIWVLSLIVGPIVGQLVKALWEWMFR